MEGRGRCMPDGARVLGPDEECLRGAGARATVRRHARGMYRFNPHKRGSTVPNPVKVEIGSSIFRKRVLVLEDPLSAATGPPLYVSVEEESRPTKALGSGAVPGMCATRNGKPGALADWPPSWVNEVANKGMLPALAAPPALLALTG
uniref:Uncharacterized protein n=1 Tax=Alexandrium monilatum TaxID=311494 RepID=A0A7S4SXK1_9DINO